MATFRQENKQPEPISEGVLEVGISLVKQAEIEKLTLRLMGGLGILYHSPKQVGLYKHFQRSPKDIDFAAFSRQRSVLRNFFQRNSFNPREDLMAFNESRSFFERPQDNIKLDVFYDKLAMCHTLDLKDRLKIDPLTLSVSDLLLQKLQIVKTDMKDFQDIIILLAEHEVADEDKDAINQQYIAKLFSKDWGLYYTATTNLKRLKDDMLGQLVKDAEIRTIVAKRISQLLKRIEDEPKSSGWKIRSKIGTRVTWYEEVDIEDFNVY